MIKIYHFIFYRMFLSISKTNQFNPESSTLWLLSTVILLNLFTLLSFVLEKLNPTSIIIIMIVGIVLGTINVSYFSKEPNLKSILDKFKSKEISPISNFLADNYPFISILLFLKSINVESFLIYLMIGVFLILILFKD